MIRSRLVHGLLGVCLLALFGPVGAQEPTTADAAAEQLIARERLRTSVEEALKLQLRSAASGEERVENFSRAALDLVRFGSEAVPFLIFEVEQELAQTFYFAAYTLGLIGTPEAEAALREAVARAERASGDFALGRKAWACFGLALLGQVEAVDLLNEGRHRAARFPFHSGMSVLEASALQTFPASLPLLAAQLERYRGEEALLAERPYTIKALGRLGAPEALAPLLAVAAEGDPRDRRDVMYALGNIDTESAIEALIRGLGDEDIRVRKAAALALDRRRPVGHAPALKQRLEEEPNPVTRGALYLVLANVEGPAALETLRRHWGQSDATDRLYLLRAVASIGDEAGLDLIQAGLVDPDLRVVAPAVEALIELGTERSLEIVRKLFKLDDWPLVQVTIEQLVSRRDAAFAPLIAERLFSNELSGVLTETSKRDPVRIMSEALVTFRHHQALEQFRQAATLQTDAQVRLDLEDVAVRLALIREKGRRTKAWIAVLTDEDQRRRGLAYEVLGELQGSEAAQALVQAFGRVEPAEGVEVLRALGRIDDPASRALIERVLVDPLFDTPERLGLREMAAWGARRLGGPPLVAALQTAIERRQGRDAKLLVYLALADAGAALPALRAQRFQRMRFIGWNRGKEYDELEWVRREVEAGRSIARLDLPPERLSF